VCGDGRVPIENSGGTGTAEVHWRESTFDNEVMTGFVEPTADMPFSAISIGSLADVGYVVNLLAADPYQVPPPPTVAPRLSSQPLAPWETVHIPLLEIGRDGTIRPVECRTLNAVCKIQK
jgi:hypothetical protein